MTGGRKSSNDFLRCVGLFDSHAESRLHKTYRPKETTNGITAAADVGFFWSRVFPEFHKILFAFGIALTVTNYIHAIVLLNVFWRSSELVKVETQSPNKKYVAMLSSL